MINIYLRETGRFPLITPEREKTKPNYSIGLQNASPGSAQNTWQRARIKGYP
ncbi:hypothetical protein KJ639_00790 [Patescibacteria group bacterium]|nr:hypothetical protein [Patescibacteria group bacterium]